MMLGVSWVYWLVGTLGIGGAVALAVFAPGVGALVVQAVARVIGWMLSTRLGCAILAACLAFVVADIHRSMSDKADFDKRTWEFEQKQAERDTRIAQETRDEVWKEIANSTAENAAIDKTVEEFKHDMAPVPALNNPFRVGADACVLRGIAGQAGCGRGKGARRVPAPRPSPAGRGDNRGLRLPGSGG